MRVRQELSLAQSLEQKIKITVITPKGICPQCGHKLTDAEIQAGWINDPYDFTTECPACEKRFVAKLRLTEKGKNVGSHDYLCLCQLFDGLRCVQRGKSKKLGKVFLSQKHPHLLWNMVRHFGTYEEGFKAFRAD